jgi:hypothetical protein
MERWRISPILQVIGAEYEEPESLPRTSEISRSTDEVEGLQLPPGWVTLIDEFLENLTFQPDESTTTWEMSALLPQHRIEDDDDFESTPQNHRFYQGVVLWQGSRP